MTVVGAVVAPVHIVVVPLGCFDRFSAGRKRSKVLSILGIGQASFFRSQVMNLMIATIRLSIPVHTIFRHSDTSI
jgi:hypothetical protein